MVERLKVFDLNVFNIASCPDRAIAIVMPVKKHRLHAFEQHTRGIIFTHLKLVSHDRHFGIKVAFGDKGIGHGVGHPTQRPVEVILNRIKGDKIIRAVQPRGAVHTKTAARKFLCGLGIVLRALKHQVFQ